MRAEEGLVGVGRGDKGRELGKGGSGNKTSGIAF